MSILVTQGLLGKTISLQKSPMKTNKNVYVGNNKEDLDLWVKENSDYIIVSNEINGKSIDTLLSLFLKGSNIAITWNIFSYHISKIQSVSHILKEYTLLLDNCLELVWQENIINTKEIKALLKNELLLLDKDNQCTFNANLFGNGDHWKDLSSTHFGKLQYFCDSGDLYLINKCSFYIMLPPKYLLMWNNVHITTMFFDGSLLKSYLEKNLIQSSLDLIPYELTEIKELINIYGYDEDDSLRDQYKKSMTGINAVGYKKNSLSSTNILNNTDSIDSLKKNMYNYFSNKVKAKKGDRLWTSLKNLARPVGENRYYAEWLPFNTKATNKYGHVHNLAYLMNLYAQPFIVHASNKKGYPIDQDMYALSEMVQWIWRSAIRNGEEINIYIPSSRMRQLLIDWLNGKYNVQEH